MSLFSHICIDANNTCTDGHMRLADGETKNEGRLEVCFFNHWGTVCDDHFGPEEAQVACRAAGFPAEGTLLCANEYGRVD